MPTIDPIVRCAICGQSILLEDSKVTEDGKPIHEECFLAKVRIQNIGRETIKTIVRCPYCILGDNFRPMIPRPEGWFVCQKCGHTAMPEDLNFKCDCKKCLTL